MTATSPSETRCLFTLCRFDGRLKFNWINSRQRMFQTLRPAAPVVFNEISIRSSRTQMGSRDASYGISNDFDNPNKRRSYWLLNPPLTFSFCLKPIVTRFLGFFWICYLWSRCWYSCCFGNDPERIMEKNFVKLIYRRRLVGM